MINRQQFSVVYKTLVKDKKFVEFSDYYLMSETRFWRIFNEIQSLKLGRKLNCLDIGGGIMGALLARLLNWNCMVGDVNDTAKNDIEQLGLEFKVINLLKDNIHIDVLFDVIIMQEVIEHIPQPPYIVLERLFRLVKDDGHIVVTTPNGHRFRNIMYMILGKEVLDFYKYPDFEGEVLGHQHEYTMNQMKKQFSKTKFIPILSKYYNDDFRGVSTSARIAKIIFWPTRFIEHWRNGMVFVLKK